MGNIGYFMGNKSVTLVFSKYGDIDVQVMDFNGEEQISALYRFEINARVKKKENVLCDNIIRYHAAFTINDGLDNHSKAAYFGIVKNVVVLGGDDEWVYFKFILEPEISKYDAYRLSEVYHTNDNESTALRDIIYDKIYVQCPLISRPDWRFFNGVENFPRRDFVCQYKESYLDFINRWLSRIGGYWFIENSGSDKETVVFTNTKSVSDGDICLFDVVDIVNASNIYPYSTDDKKVFDFSATYNVLPQSVTVFDYNYRTGLNSSIKHCKVIDGDSFGMVFFYAKNLKTDSEAIKFTDVYAESLSCRKVMYSCRTLNTGIRPGQNIAFKSNNITDLKKMFVTSVKHAGTRAGNDELSYSATVYGISSESQYRSEISDNWPCINGLLYSFVDSEYADTTDLNDRGEYLVKLPFDETFSDEDRGSVRIRMVTAFNSDESKGMHFPLVKGTEVVLSFIGGDPDQPVIMGAVPNCLQESPVTDKNCKTFWLQTYENNRITLNDAKGDINIDISAPSSDAAKGSSIHLGDFGPGVAGVKIKSALSSITVGDIDEIGTAGIELETLGKLNLMVAGDVDEVTLGNQVSTTKGARMENYLGAFHQNYVGASLEVFVGNNTDIYFGGNEAVNAGFCFNFNIGPNYEYSNLKSSKTLFKNEVTIVAQENFNILIKSCNTNIDTLTADLKTTNIKVDKVAIKVDKVASEIDGIDIKIKNIGTEISKTATNIENLQVDIKRTATDISECKTSVEKNDVAIKQLNTEVKAADIVVYKAMCLFS